MPAQSCRISSIMPLTLSRRAIRWPEWRKIWVFPSRAYDWWMSVDDVDAGYKEGLTSFWRKELVEVRRGKRVLELEIETH